MRLTAERDAAARAVQASTADVVRDMLPFERQIVALHAVVDLAALAGTGLTLTPQTVELVALSLSLATGLMQAERNRGNNG